MKCKKYGSEFEKGLFCPECGQGYEDKRMLKSEEEGTNVDGNSFSEEKNPILLSIPVIFLVGLLTCGIGSIIMAIVRLKKYPERRKSSIAIIVILIVFFLLVICSALTDSQTETSATMEENRSTMDEISDLDTELRNETKEASNDRSIGRSNETGPVKITDKEIYAVLSEWQASGLKLTELGFPKNDVALSSISHIETAYADKSDPQSNLVVEVEFQEDGYHYYFDFIYGYSSEDEEWYAKDVEKCRGNEWVMLQPTDKEISLMLLEKETNDEYDYSDIVIKQKGQDFFTFTAEVSCTVTSTEGIKSTNYIFIWIWENEIWNFVQIQEPEPSLFEPLKEPDDSYAINIISKKEEELLKEDDGRKKRIEFITKDWKNTDEEYSYMYQYLQIVNSNLVETRQNINMEIRFDRETGYWKYENIDCEYSENFQKIYTIEGIWEGLEYETYEASWKYIVEILSINPDNQEITINSWCEFSPNGGEVEITSVCNEEKVAVRNGEYIIPVGGYIVDHVASKGMDFTYKYVVEDGMLFINEESDIMFLSVSNSQMSIFLGIEMQLRN